MYAKLTQVSVFFCKTDHINGASILILLQEVIKAVQSHTDIVEIPAQNVCAYRQPLLAQLVKV